MASVVEGIAVVLAIALTLTFRQILKRENEKLDEKDRREGVDSEGKFRYIY